MTVAATWTPGRRSPDVISAAAARDGRVTTVRPLCDRLAHDDDDYRQKMWTVCAPVYLWPRIRRVAKRRVARSRRRLLAVASLGVYPGLHSGRFCRITSRDIFAESPLTTFEHLPAKRIFLRVKLTWRDSRIYYRDAQLAHNHYRRHNCIHVVLCFWSVSSNLNFNSRFFNLNFYSYF